MLELNALSTGLLATLITAICNVFNYNKLYDLEGPVLNEKQLARNIQSVGKSCFVKYFNLFASESINRIDIIEILKNENTYSEKSCISRTGHAKSIINAGLGVKALQSVVDSDSRRISEETRIKAQKLIHAMRFPT